MGLKTGIQDCSSAGHGYMCLGNLSSQGQMLTDDDWSDKQNSLLLVSYKSLDHQGNHQKARPNPNKCIYKTPCLSDRSNMPIRNRQQ